MDVLCLGENGSLRSPLWSRYREVFVKATGVLFYKWIYVFFGVVSFCFDFRCWVGFVTGPRE